MKKAWGFINDKRYFTFFFVAFLAIIKLFYNYLGIPIISYIYAIPVFKFVTIAICFVAILNLSLLLIILSYFKIRYNQWADDWQKENTGKTSEKILAIFFKPQPTFAGIIYYGFFIFFSLYVSWSFFFYFFAITVLKKIYNILFTTASVKHS